MCQKDRFRLGAALFLLALPLAAGCAARPAVPQASRAAAPSQTLNPFVYFEDGGMAFVAVDGRAAQYIKDERIFPLGFSIANRSKGTLTLTRESFVLEDESGAKTPPVSYAEFASGYGRARTDAGLADSFREMMRLRFESYALASWPLYPSTSSSATARERLELGRSQYTISYLYFPVPAGGIHGKSFTVLVKANEAADSLVVRFRIR
jgi:hypothetical protein